MSIECTATDLTKAHLVLNILFAMFSCYSAVPFSAERVRVQYSDGTEMATLDFRSPKLSAAADYIKRLVDIDIGPDDVIRHLARMQLPAGAVESTFEVDLPIVRPDLLAPCDIICDVAIGYGFKRVEERVPKIATVAVNSRSAISPTLCDSRRSRCRATPKC